MNIFKSWF